MLKYAAIILYACVVLVMNLHLRKDPATPEEQEAVRFYSKIW